MKLDLFAPNQAKPVLYSVRERAVSDVDSTGVCYIKTPVRALALTGRMAASTRLLTVPAEEAGALLSYIANGVPLPAPPDGAYPEFPVVLPDTPLVVRPGEVLDMGARCENGVAMALMRNRLAYIVDVTGGGTRSLLTNETLQGGVYSGEEARVRYWADAPAVANVWTERVPEFVHGDLVDNALIVVDVIGAAHVTVSFHLLFAGVLYEPGAGQVPTNITIGWLMARGANQWPHSRVVHADDQWTASARGIPSTSHYCETYEVPRGATALVVYSTDTVTRHYAVGVC